MKTKCFTSKAGITNYTLHSTPLWPILICTRGTTNAQNAIPNYFPFHRFARHRRFRVGKSVGKKTAEDVGCSVWVLQPSPLFILTISFVPDVFIRQTVRDVGSETSVSGVG